MVIPVPRASSTETSFQLKFQLQFIILCGLVASENFERGLIRRTLLPIVLDFIPEFLSPKQRSI